MRDLGSGGWERGASAFGLMLAACLPETAFAQQTDAPRSGWTLALGFGGGWNSNPLELTTRAKGDVYVRQDAALSYRWVLWQDASLSLSASGASTAFAREASAGTHRGALSASFSQKWQETTFTLSLTERSAISHDFKRHDSASREIALGAARTFTLRKDLTLGITGGVSRRFLFDGTEDQFRARLGATLAQKWGSWTFRVGGNFGYALEDKTPFLPRINDRMVSAFMGASYEWAKDREIGMRFSVSRAYSSYPYDRYIAYGIGPSISATIKF